MLTNSLRQATRDESASKNVQGSSRVQGPWLCVFADANKTVVVSRALAQPPVYFLGRFRRSITKRYTLLVQVDPNDFGISEDRLNETTIP